MKEEIPAISFLSAGKRFEQNNTSFDVLSRVTGHIQKGSITALIGPSGAGKSTLLSLCNLMNTPDEGEVLVFGKEIRRWDIRELQKNRGPCISISSRHGGHGAGQPSARRKTPRGAALYP